MKNILVTGASTGIGFDCVKTLKQKGFNVFATVRDKNSFQKLEELGIKVFLMDIDKPNEIQNVVNSILQKTDEKIDALFNNAGFGQPGAVEDLNRDTIRAQFETNLFGVLQLTNLIIPSMRKNNYGRLIFNSSMLGIVPLQYRGAYNASKYAMEGLFSTLRLELKNTNIKVSFIEPGPIKSSFRMNAFAKFKQNINYQQSKHLNHYQKMLDSFTTSKTPFTLKPSAVTEKVLHILNNKNPKLHYPVTFPAHLSFVLKRLLPTKLLDKFCLYAGK